MLSECSLSGRIPLGLADLPKFQFLRLNSNGGLRASTSQLLGGKLEKIQILHLSRSGIHGKLPTSMGNLSSLTYLDFSYNDVQGGIPSSIGKLCNLEVFLVRHNNLTGTLPESLEKSKNCASRSTLLTSLQCLDLSYNQLTGRLPKLLGQLKNLIELRLNVNLLEGPIPVSLYICGRNLKNLT